MLSKSPEFYRRVLWEILKNILSHFFRDTVYICWRCTCIPKTNLLFYKLEHYRQTDTDRCDWRRYNAAFTGGRNNEMPGRHALPITRAAPTVLHSSALAKFAYCSVLSPCDYFYLAGLWQQPLFWKCTGKHDFALLKSWMIPRNYTAAWATCCCSAPNPQAPMVGTMTYFFPLHRENPVRHWKQQILLIFCKHANKHTGIRHMQLKFWRVYWTMILADDVHTPRIQFAGLLAIFLQSL